MLKRQAAHEVSFMSVSTLEALGSSNSRYCHDQISCVALAELSQQQQKDQAKTKEITGSPPHSTALTGWWDATDP